MRIRLPLVSLFLALLAPLVPIAAEEAPASPSRFQIEIDERVPEDLLRLVDGRIIDDDSLDAWVDLPGNAELLRIGAARGGLDREELRENLWHTVLGHRLRRGEGLGSLAFDPIGDLRSMLVEVSGRKEEIERAVAAHLESYLPEEVPEIRAVVRLHLGGTWDGRTRDDVYLNLSFLHNYAAPWFGAIEGILAHEMTHLAQVRLDALPEDAQTPEGLFGVALSQIHSEGIARQIEMGLLDGRYADGTYAASVVRRYREGLVGFSDTFRKIEDLREVCLRRRDQAECRRMIHAGLWRGGDTYVIGQGMARAIEMALGRKTLGTTLTGGGARFFELYAQSAKMLPGFPALGPGFDADLASASAYLDSQREMWRLRREARAAHLRGDYLAASTLLRKLLELDRADPTAAYNLACALARRGDGDGAIEWLERAIDLGYSDRGFIESDSDLDSIRDAAGYRRLMDRMASPGTEKLRTSTP